MIQYFCRECGEEVEGTGEVLFCPLHQSAIIDSIVVDEGRPMYKIVDTSNGYEHKNESVEVDQEAQTSTPESWCCMQCCAAGKVRLGHCACTPTEKCGWYRNHHEPQCHGKLV